ncbi:GvpL/GvpF family gas vesicle protein [Priestia koreensis]|nr:GvpL/GvpF family gas vesicle protein [Priestia koreensis]
MKKQKGESLKNGKTWPSGRDDEMIYLYGLIPTAEAVKSPLSSLKGLDDEEHVYTIPINDVTAVVCLLNSDKYSEEILQQKMENDMDWLKEKAFHHHETLAALYSGYTVIPLKFGTIYNSEESLKETIAPKNNVVIHTFETLKRHEEWNMKVYCDDQKLMQHVTDHDEVVEQKRQEIESLPKGRQYFEKKKLDKFISQQLEEEKYRLCKSVHDQLLQYATNEAVKKNWGKDMTGLQESMVWNSAFMLPKEAIEEFLEEIKKSEPALLEKGLRVEVSGPWPPYHFSNIS